MESIVSRYEFRVWGDELGDTATRIRSQSGPGSTRESAETYIVSANTLNVNAKVRAKLLDVKSLESKRDGFERWSPGQKLEFPVPAAWLEDYLFPVWKVDPPAITRPDYTLSQLLEEFVHPQDGLAAVPVEKRRHAFQIDGSIAEVADVIIGPRSLQTVAVESPDLDALRTLVDQLGLGTETNTSYPRIIHATLGWTDA